MNTTRRSRDRGAAPDVEVDLKSGMMPGMNANDLLGKTIYDVDRKVGGRVSKVYAPREYVSPVNKQPVSEYVLELESGESFIAPEKSLARWTVLGPAEEAYARDVSAALGQVVTALCKVAAGLKIRPTLAFLVLGRTLQIQGGLLLTPPESEMETW